MSNRSSLFAVGASIALIALPLFAQHAPATPPPADRVTVPAGPFTMGADDGGEQDEHPAHSVTLPAFAIDRTEVSNAHYRLCVRAHACEEASEPERFRDADMPVTGVTWAMAGAYCRWSGGRLATEQEFEKAARGTDARRYTWGNDAPTSQRAVYGQRMNVGRPEPVGTHPAGAGPYGALDMAGNVWEWTATVYDPFAYTRPTSVPTCESAEQAFAQLRHENRWGFTGANGIPNQCERVLRGGAWNYHPEGLRASNRVHHPPTFRSIVAGIRCAADVR